MKLEVNFILPPNCQITIGSKAVTLRVTLTVKTSSLNHIYFKEFERFTTSKKQSYVATSIELSHEKLNQTDMYNEYLKLLNKMRKANIQIKMMEYNKLLNELK